MKYKKVCNINFDRFLNVIKEISKHLRRIIVLKKLLDEWHHEDNSEFIDTLTEMKDESIKAILHELDKLELAELQLISRWLSLSCDIDIKIN